MSIFNLDPIQAKCSRAGCSQPAKKSLIWANPSIHKNGKSKTWLSCEEHLEYLRAFLTDRSFLKQEGDFS
jgi:hypothetical protein